MKQVFTIQFKKISLVLLILFSVTGCDQITKQVARQVVPATGEIWLWPNHLLVTLMQNEGVFLSLGAQWPDVLRSAVFNFGVGGFLLLIVWGLFRRKTRFLPTLALSFLFAGGLSNLLDRLTMGSVTDMFYFKVGQLSTGIFNLADVVIVMACIFLAFDGFRQQQVTTPEKCRPN